MFHCPICGQDLLPITLSEGIGVACDKCSFGLHPDKRTKPFESLTQAEINAARHSGTYDYYNETLRLSGNPAPVGK